MEEGVLHIKPLNWPVMGDITSEHYVDDSRFHNRVKSLVVVDPRVLSKTSKDPAFLVVIKGPIGVKLVREDPLVGDDVGATGHGDKFPHPLIIRALYSSSIATRQLGPASTTSIEDGIRDSVDEDVDAVRTRRARSTWKLALTQVTQQETLKLHVVQQVLVRLHVAQVSVWLHMAQLGMPRPQETQQASSRLHEAEIPEGLPVQAEEPQVA
jgi:hypothetical protein